MPAVYIPPGASSSYPEFQTSTHTDQIGLNAAPVASTLAQCLYVSPMSTQRDGVSCSLTINETDRAYDGTDTIRQARRRAGYFSLDCENNDPSWTGINQNGFALYVNVDSGRTKTSYGTPIALVTSLQVHDHVPSPHFNEYACHFQALLGAHNYQSTFGGGSYWFTDMACHGPMGQPNILQGFSFVINNYNASSPAFGKSSGFGLQSAPKAGPDFSVYVNPGTGVCNTTYPVDIGYFVSGLSSGGTGDGFTNAIQVGGTLAVWNQSSEYGGDQGQVGRGVVVKARNAGNSVARLGAFVSEGTGESGGLVFGLDTNDANRASISRPVAGVMTFRGKMSFANGGYATSTTATPANVVGKIAAYNDAGTLLGYLPIYGSL